MLSLREIIKKHLELLEESREAWDLSKLRDITSSYTNLTDFLQNERNAANALRRKGVFDEYTSHMTRPQKKYTDEELFDIAKQYKSISDLKKERAGVYSAILRRGMLDKLKTIIQSKITNWSDEMLRQEAEKYSRKSDFRDKSGSAYVLAKSRGIFDEITKHMDQIKIWTYDEAKKEAEKYLTFSEFTKNSPAFYQSKKNGWIEDFKEFLTTQEEWDFDKIKSIAADYETIKDFRKNEPKAYHAAHRYHWIDQVTKHMSLLGDKFKRMVYVYEFPDNYVYVGLTLNKKNRHLDHMDIGNPKTPVAKHIIKSGLQPEYKEISTGYIDAKEAGNLENCTIELYRQQGWNILNTQKGGNLGYCKRTEHTAETIKDIAKKFIYRSDFKRSHPREYAIAQKYGWLPYVVSDIPKKDTTKWTYEKTKELASKFNTRSELKKNNQSAYQSARVNNWLDEFFPMKYVDHGTKVSKGKK